MIEDLVAAEPTAAVDFLLLREQLHSVLGALSGREAGVVAMRFGLTGSPPETFR